MTYLQLAYLHLITIVPAFLIGTFLILSRKGTFAHRKLGPAYMLLMITSAVVTLFMPARVGPTLFKHFGLIHLLSLLVLYSVPTAFIAIKQGNIKKHRASMTGLYFGGLILAGIFALMPGRMLNQWIFG
ncbi:hypothetical protein BTA51_16170 [Hahella sp. CCB-MM4]|uniref:DUF2306 domain-containing protein n=1 Tax=Hahella sp. (strain CCB-MM4) TaxID=1926491 RepID=UPI000B9AE622|nr:DUF2306 domain-containing protein [Hahella sp. CCB-MM4]OZG72275.1 hypothetical protein BTA51_16170 [Hahella sp. CCB-MM4]